MFLFSKAPIHFVMVAACLLGAMALSAQETFEPVDESPTRDEASSDALISEREEVAIVTDSNVAEAVSRRPDLKFNNITIDGERSSLALEDIPADAVDDLEVLRAVTPDLDADSRGGSLNLSSNPSFKLKQPVVKAEAYMRYSAKEDAWEQGSSATYGRAYGDLGFRVTLSQSNEHDVSESIRMEWEQTPEDETLFAPSYLFEKFSETWRVIYNLNSSLDYRISDNFYLYTRLNLYKNNTTGYEPNIRYKYENGTYHGITSDSGSSSGAQVDRDLTGWEGLSENFDMQFGGFLDTERFKLDFRIYQEGNAYEEPDWTVTQFRIPHVDLDYELDGDHFPIPNQATGDVINDASAYDFDEHLSERWQNFTHTFIASLNSKYLFEWGANTKAYVKAGLKYRSNRKDQRSDSRIYTGYDGSFTMDAVSVDYGEDSLVIDGLNYGDFPTLATSRDFLHEHFDQFQYDILRSAQKSDPATYLATEDISAAYAMLNINHNHLRSIIGLRIERTDLDYLAREVLTDANMTYLGTERRSGSRQYSNLFPAVHVRYFLGQRITLIGAWTMTIERPWYGNIVPYRFINYDSSEIEEGNPGLDPTLYRNFDCSMDYRLSEASMFSVELFSHDIDDIVFWEVTEIESGPLEGFTLERNANGPSAIEQGIRLILSQNLADWNASLEGMSMILKGTFQNSETEYPERPEETMPVTYRPSSILEATLSYDRGPVYAQVRYSHYTKELESVFENSWEDRYHKSHSILDLSASYQVSDNLRMFLEADNLLGTQYDVYSGNPSRPAARYWRSTHYQFGLKFSI